MPATYTPIRYPGGKTKIYPLMKAIIDGNGLSERAYCEAFAGGAGLAMKLLLKGDVPFVIINDYDRAVWCMWNAVVNHSEELCDFIDDSQVTIDEWLVHRDTYKSQDGVDDIALGKAAFFLNRTNVSGILDGGVIGGIDQKGNYPIDARFSKDGLKKKVRAVAEKRGNIELYMLDVEEFVREVLGPRSEDVFCYFDPPYVQKGPGLYHSSFDVKKHCALAKAIMECRFPWVVTYDDDTLIDELYGKNVIDHIALAYSAHSAGKGVEKLILADNLRYQKTA